MRHGVKYIKAIVAEVMDNSNFRQASSPNKIPGRQGRKRSLYSLSKSARLTHLTVVFDEILRRAQKIPGVISALR